MAAKRKFVVFFFVKVSELHVNNLGALLGQSEVVPKPILMSLVKTLAKTKEPSSQLVSCFMVFIQVDPRRANRWVYFTQTK